MAILQHRADRDAMSAIRRGFAGRCPNCGMGRLFGRYLKPVAACSHCGERLDLHQADDLPAYLVILIVGHVVVGTMLAVGRTTRGRRTVFFEFLRIEQTPDAITYHAAPKGRAPATPFKMTQVADGKVVFENPQHDFPVRITYWRDGPDGMRAKVEGKDGHGAGSWAFTRVTTSQR